MDGVIIIDKPSGMTSHDVVAKVKRVLGARKVGHLGTLDPMATGVLPLVINKATKFAIKLQGDMKQYRAVMKLGEDTDTCDAEGQVVSTAPTSGIMTGEVTDVLKTFLGKISQVPPMYSAVKQGGVPLYKLARKGIVVEREPKEVEVYSIETLKVEVPFVTFTVACSRGTYIRTICHDAGEKLGCGAHLFELKRTLSGRFAIEGAVELDSTKEALKAALLPLDELVEETRGGDRLVS